MIGIRAHLRLQCHFQNRLRSIQYDDRNIKGIHWILPVITFKCEIMNFGKKKKQLTNIFFLELVD